MIRGMLVKEINFALSLPKEGIFTKSSNAERHSLNTINARARSSVPTELTSCGLKIVSWMRFICVDIRSRIWDNNGSITQHCWSLVGHENILKHARPSCLIIIN